MKKIVGSLFVSDLDGTLLRSDRTFADEDIAALELLGRAGVIRAIATGRSPMSFRRLLNGRILPVDYLILSTGTGIIECDTERIILRRGLSSGETRIVSSELMNLCLDFTVQGPFPDNQVFMFHQSGDENPDFHNRLSLYEGFYSKLDPCLDEMGPSSQVVAIVPEQDGLEALDLVTDKLGKKFNVVRTTSPLDGKTMWIEVFPGGVSKSSGAGWLAGELGISVSRCAAVGNDYNDLDLLEWAGRSYAVENAPVEIRKGRPVVPSNNNCGVACAVNDWFPVR